MELLQLKYFYESAKHESFTHAAKKYMVPLTSISIAIKRLEEELGVKLFDRASNRVSLNDKGRQFYYSVQSMFDELHDGILLLKHQTLGEKEIRILAKSSRETILRHTIAFNKIYPDVKFLIDVQYDAPGKEFDNYDIIIDEKGGKYKDYEYFDLCAYKIYVECLSSNPLCQRPSVSLKQLKYQPFVTANKNTGSFAIFAAACKKKGFYPNIVLECNDYTCRDKCVISGTGMGVTFGNTTNSPLPDVQYLNISDFNVRYITCVYYRPSSNTGTVKAFIDFVKTRLM